MFNKCLEISLKIAHFCILNSSFLSHFVRGVSSPYKTPRSSSKLLCCRLYFQLSSHCFIWWWNTASHAWYLTSIRIVLMVSGHEIFATRKKKKNFVYDIRRWTRDNFELKWLPNYDNWIWSHARHLKA